ncbi:MULTISPECIES: MFS transporter [Flavobacterium]|uniref:MFS transporter n=1 Tax=Flavobacterium hankyongi TaxID=1176532 RepID=A0ABP8ZKS3_9FLAO|nr:MFS transporter [Flavobacterium sp. N1846]
MSKLLDSYKGLPREVWMFALMTIINRIGAMVVPFLSKYLREDLKFEYLEIGTIMLCFGLGSIIGTILSGRLTNNFSTYKIMVFSMFTSGLILLFMRFIKDFYLLCFVVFLYNVIADMFRPAMTATIKDYVKKKNRVNAFSLVRTASNLAFVISPVIAGFVILTFGYKYLFFIDGLSSIIAILVFVLFVKEKKDLYKIKFTNYKEEEFAFLKDKLLLLHCLVTIITGFVFFQFFTVLPIFYTDFLKLSSEYNSYSLIFYGILLFGFELQVVHFIKKKSIHPLNSILQGLVFLAIGNLFLSFASNYSFVIGALIFISLGVMLSFPFAPDFVLERAFKKQEGKFLSFFQMSYSVAHILSAKVSMFIIASYGFKWNFVNNIFVSLFGVLISYFLIRRVIEERKSKEKDIVKSIFG